MCLGQSNNEIELNRRPLIEFGESFKERIQSGKVNVDAPFVFEASGKLDKAGKIVPSTFKITRSEGDANTLEIIKNAISAVNDARYFAYLRSMDITDVTFLLKQDVTIFTGQVSSEMVNDQRANSLASVFAMLTKMAISRKQGAQPVSQSDKNDGLLLNSMSTSASGKTFIIKFELAKGTLRDILTANLSTK